MRVLVVEDETPVAAAVKRGLEGEGYAVDIAATGGDGLWLARENPYDAIILDIMLPELTGYDVCAALRAEGNWTPILMLTAKDGDLDEARALALIGGVQRWTCARWSRRPTDSSIRRNSARPRAHLRLMHPLRRLIQMLLKARC